MKVQLSLFAIFCFFSIINNSYGFDCYACYKNGTSTGEDINHPCYSKTPNTTVTCPPRDADDADKPDKLSRDGCMKILTKHSITGKEASINRGCIGGTDRSLPEKDECITFDLGLETITACYCFKDKCNSASGLIPTILIPILTLITLYRVYF